MVITLRISKELHERIKVMAKKRNESMNGLCLMAIDQILSEIEQQTITPSEQSDKESACV